MHFFTFDGVIRAVDDVSFFLEAGEGIGLVGESGCGKIVTTKSIMRLIPEPPGRTVDGQIIFDGLDLATLSTKQMTSIRGKRIPIVFQEPMSFLNPVYSIGDQISEMFYLHQGLSRRESWDRSAQMFKMVQIPAPGKRLYEYPRQPSVGMRQRVMIAVALDCRSEILIADEPTTALDVTIQAQIIDLFLYLLF